MTDDEYDAKLAQQNAETLRETRWHATYDAALGRLACFTHGAGTTQAEIDSLLNATHESCVLYANRAHGPLVKP